MCVAKGRPLLRLLVARALADHSSGVRGILMDVLQVRALCVFVLRDHP